jgi:hypothetical protein
VSPWVLELENPVSPRLGYFCGLDLDFAKVNTRAVGDVYDGTSRNVLLELRNRNFAGLAAVRVFIMRV